MVYYDFLLCNEKLVWDQNMVYFSCAAIIGDLFLLVVQGNMNVGSNFKGKCISTNTYVSKAIYVWSKFQGAWFCWTHT